VLYGLYQRRIRRWLATQEMPKHVAMILDGNRRWARQNALATSAYGHRAGAAKFREFLVWCDDLGIAVTTLYLLSTDNLSGRKSEELDQLYEIIADLAEDLSQEVFLRIHRGLPYFQGEASLATWVERTTSELCPGALVATPSGGASGAGAAHISPSPQFVVRTLGRIRRVGWRREQLLDIVFNVTIALVGIATVGLIWYFVDASGSDWQSLYDQALQQCLRPASPMRHADEAAVAS